MHTHITVVILSVTSIIVLSIISWTLLIAWREWLALKRMALRVGEDMGSPSSPTARIELAALRERVRKLEAIASGVDLLP